MSTGLDLHGLALIVDAPNTQHRQYYCIRVLPVRSVYASRNVEHTQPVGQAALAL